MTQPPTTEQRLAAIREILDALVEYIKSCPRGAPCGELYAILMPYGCTLEHYQAIEATLLRADLVTKSNDCLFYKEADRGN